MLLHVSFVIVVIHLVIVRVFVVEANQCRFFFLYFLLSYISIVIRWWSNYQEW